MKKLIFLSFLIPSALCAYVIQNNSGAAISAKFIYRGEQNETKLFQSIEHGKSRSETLISAGNIAGEEIRIDQVEIEKNVQPSPENIINLSQYSDEQITRTENPVVFTINPDFTITASEPGNRFEIPPAPPAPFPPAETTASVECKASSAAAKNGNGYPKKAGCS